MQLFRMKPLCKNYIHFKNIMDLKKVKHIVLLLLVGIFLSCSEEQLNIDRENTIVGKWKLEKTEHPMSGQHFDYSLYNVVYEFKTNNVLTVSTETENSDIWPYTGEYSYSFIDDEKGYGIAGLPYGLKIGDDTYWYRISTEKLEINNAPVDGGIWYFTKNK